MTTAEAITTFVEAIDRLGSERADDAVYVHVNSDGTDRLVTGRSLSENSAKLAGVLAERGLAFEGRLGLGLRNSPQFVESAFAAWRLRRCPRPGPLGCAGLGA